MAFTAGPAFLPFAMHRYIYLSIVPSVGGWNNVKSGKRPLSSLGPSFATLSMAMVHVHPHARAAAMEPICA